MFICLTYVDSFFVKLTFISVSSVDSILIDPTFISLNYMSIVFIYFLLQLWAFYPD